MIVPSDIAGMIYEFAGPIVKRYRPIKGFEEKIPIGDLYIDPYLIGYLLEKYPILFDMNLFMNFATEELAAKLRFYIKEKDMSEENECYIFPIFYGKERVNEYIEKYPRYSVIYDVMRKSGSHVVEKLYFPLLVELTKRGYYCPTYSKSIWEILSKNCEDFDVLEANTKFIDLESLSKNRSPRALDLYINLACARMTDMSEQEVIYVASGLMNFQKFPANLEFFLRREASIVDSYFSQNPAAVEYYLERPERIPPEFAENADPVAIGYMARNLDKFPDEDDRSSILWGLSRSPLATPYLLENPELINVYAVQSNPDFGIIYEKYPEMFDFELCEDTSYHIRDFARERCESIKFLIEYVFEH